MAELHNFTRQGWTPEPDAGRGTAGIVWQCLVTISLCVYVAVHLNVPPVPLSRMDALLQKATWVLIGLLAPEMICVKAINENSSARHFAKCVRRSGHPISQQQAFYILNGGVMFRNLEKSWDGYRQSHEETEWVLKPGYGDEFTQSRPVSQSAKDMAIFLAMNVPKDEEINDKSDADALSKLLVCLQTSWTLLSIISRAAQHLPISLLEITTSAYIVLMTAAYAFWFYKPYNVSTVSFCDASLAKGQVPTDSHWWVESTSFRRDSAQRLKFRRLLGWDMDSVLYGDLRGLGMLSGIAALFGGIHCLAWNYAFASTAEKWLWLSTSISVLAVPAVTAASSLLDDLLNSDVDSKRFCAFVVWAIFLGVMYLLSRLYMIVEGFLAFRNAPSGIYDKVQWTSYFGHFGG